MKIFSSQKIKISKICLYALRQLKRFFNPSQMRLLLDSYFYSVLYYNSVVWLTPSLKSDLKHDLLAVSAWALRSCMMNPQCEVSFINVHKLNKKCTPQQIMLYQISINLYKTLNYTTCLPPTEVIRVIEQIISTRRQVLFETFCSNRSKIGMNANENKFYHINKQIPLANLNLNFEAYKRLMKIKFLLFGNT